MLYSGLFRVQLALIALQGYLDYFNVSFFHSRIMTWSPFVLFCIILIGGITNTKVNSLKTSTLMISFLLLFTLLWAAIGYSNDNYSTNQDIKSILIAIATTYVTFTVTSDRLTTRNTISYFCMSILPLITLDVIDNLPGQLESIHSLGRYRMISIFVYIFYLTKLVHNKNSRNLTIYGTIISLLNSTIFPLSKSKIAMTILATILILILSRMHNPNTQSNLSKYIGLAIVLAIVFIVVNRSLNNNENYYRRYLIDRGLRAWQYQDKDIADALSYTLQQDNVANLLTSGRIEIWKKTIEDIKEKPMLGHGIGYYQQDYGQYSHLSVHNVYLYLFVSLGFLGTSILGFAFYKIYRIIQSSMRVPIDYDLKIVSLTMIFVTSFHGLFAIIFSFHALLIIFSVSLGLILKSSERSGPQPLDSIS